MRSGFPTVSIRKIVSITDAPVLVEAVATDSTGDRVDAHLACPQCGYDLFGMPLTGQCPECGTRVGNAMEFARFASDNRRSLIVGSRNALITGCLSGLCPASCILWMAVDRKYVAAIPVTLVFLATMVYAIRTQFALGGLTFPAAERVRKADPARFPFRMSDLAAAVGLIMLCIAACLGSERTESAFDFSFLATAFTLLAATAWRFVPEWRAQGVIVRCLRNGKRGVGNGFSTLGWFKAIYETLWLGCCAVALWCIAASEADWGSSWSDTGIMIAFGALFGLAGYGILWITMITMHTRLFLAVRRRMHVGA